MTGRATGFGGRLNFNNAAPEYGARYAGLTISLLPMIAVYIFTGKHVFGEFQSGV